jgi:hypothetical protein
MQIIPIARPAEVEVIADSALVARSLEVLPAAPITSTLVRGGALCWWSRRRGWRWRPYSCAAQGVHEHGQEGLALAVGAPRTDVAGA